MPVQGRGAFPRAAPETRYHASHNASQIAEYRALKGLPRADDALKMLRSVGSIVRPIMLKHGWRLPLLTEFTGSQKGGGELLGMNVNRGQKIFLRLREKGSDGRMLDSFLPEDDVVYTMLHELTHNWRGPHDEEFFRLLSGLEEEWYELRRTGGKLPGQGFLTAGSTLGGGPSVPPHQRRQKMQQIAEQRRRVQGLLQGGGRLGSCSNSSSLASTVPPAQLAALAAEKRAKMDKGCPSSQLEQDRTVKWHEEEELLHGVKVIRIDEDDEEDIVSSPFEQTGAIGSPKTASTESAREKGPSSMKSTEPQYIELETDSDDDGSDIVITSVKRSRKESAQSRHKDTARRRNDGAQSTATHDQDVRQNHPGWDCEVCTFRNSHLEDLCVICRAPRPNLSAAQLLAATRAPVVTPSAAPPRAGSNDVGWKCAECGHWMLGEQSSFWICAKCSALAKK